MVKLMIDPGHEGVEKNLDPGAVANGLKEADLTLKIAKHIYDMLSEYEGVQVRMTRTGNQCLTLSQRAKMANDWGADFFLSIHINAGGGTGFESYVHPNANSATIAYQNVIHAEIMKAIGDVRDRGKKRANYAVLRETKMPALLTENLFIDNANDAAKLKSDQFLQQIAYGHVIGLEKAFGLKKKAKPTPSQPQQKVSDGKLYRVQVGAFSDRKNAEKLAEELKKKGYPAIIV
ncbi:MULTISPECIES: N-acetylmuramoyl-L-alanine amidase [unclassified Geobacillus]|uniref:N-acetylmuramoyl-L-alanine amidase n=1 Tax=unclassified Geobacillus TaxID=2642459 RepID=UPI000D36134F|nr:MULTISPECIES: N-acetylmuramoyl-L-alanine amidase [unclassified Geobacillus]PUF85664.1 N-acetylmuramoyl-L-alanine amidase [Geobacillus sp. LYN3]TXK89080.1 N-acetylmuramoyl-L-alanine amidase [Geobacillus sp. AYS3]